MKICLIGNCQIRVVTAIFNMAGINVAAHSVSIPDVSEDFEPDFRSYDFVVVQDHARLAHLKKYKDHEKFVSAPALTFMGYYPDILHIKGKVKELCNQAQSNIITNSFAHGLSQQECAELFSDTFTAKLGYQERFDVSRDWLSSHLTKNGLDGNFLVSKWFMRSPFTSLPEHPELFVSWDVTVALGKKMGIELNQIDLSRFMINMMQGPKVFPAYNSPVNSLTSRDLHYKIDGRIYSLPQYIAMIYKLLEQEFALDSEEDNIKKIPADRYETFKAALAEHRADNTPLHPHNPYRELPSTSFWRKSVAAVKPGNMAPIAAKIPLIGENTKVATAGSCFAQHIARTLSKQGLNYYVAEQAPTGMDPEEASTKGYDLFSARYGNIYTTRQLLQLFRRAYGLYEPQDQYWIAKSGKYLDPFRPNLGEEFDSIADMLASREVHFAAVRTMFEELDVFVFTLGLTECWVNSHDSAVYPVAPGVISQHRSYGNYAFRNFTKEEIQADLIDFLGLLRSVNRQAKVLLTVSPVPLIATYEDDHVLSATSYSKSVLRSVAGDVSNAFDFVSYFPSFEIITGSFNKGAYFEADLRSVRQEGVDHVMGVLMDTLVVRAGEAPPAPEPEASPEINENILKDIEKAASVVCDEELIESD